MRKLHVLSLCDKTGNMVQPWLKAGHDATIIDIQHDNVERGCRREVQENGAVLTIVRCDVRDLVDRDGNAIPLMFSKFDIVFGFPPCDNLAVAGARWFKEKGLSALILSLEIVNACRIIAEQSGAPFFLENPRSTLKSYWRDPDFTFHPWQYCGFNTNDTYTKTTNLWAGNEFIMPEHNVHPETLRVIDEVAEKYPKVKGHNLIKKIQADPAIDHQWFPDDRIHQAGPSADRGNIRSATPMGFAQAVFEVNEPVLTGKVAA